MTGFNPTRIFSFLLHDRVSLIEVLSSLNLLAWANVLYQQPDLLMRDSYQSFQSLPALVWIGVFGGVALLQILGIFAWHLHATRIRFISMALAAGCWAAIAVNFLISGVSTTATANYLLLAFATIVSGGFLGWKTSS